MSPVALVPSSDTRSKRGPRGASWLFGPWTDLAVFGGSAALAFLLVGWARAAGLSELPEWGYLAFVLAVFWFEGQEL